jgi:hypothetical protein
MLLALTVSSDAPWRRATAAPAPYAVNDIDWARRRINARSSEIKSAPGRARASTLTLGVEGLASAACAPAFVSWL